MRIRIFESKPAKQASRSNALGGLSPSTEQEKERAKHSDLITLPESVAGTNCGNCRFSTEQEKGKLYCAHEDVQQSVTSRMCCKYWDHQDVKRTWND